MTSKVVVLPNFLSRLLGGVDRLGQEGGCELLGGEVGGLSAEFAELHFSVSHRNSGGGRRVCGAASRPDHAGLRLRAALVLEACLSPGRGGGGGMQHILGGFYYLKLCCTETIRSVKHVNFSFLRDVSG